MTKRIVLFSSTFIAVMLFCGVAFAQGAGAADNQFTLAAYTALAAGLAIGGAAFGGALGQARAAAAALEGIARNPNASGRIFTPFILSLALIESLVIYALLIAIFLNTHVGNIVATITKAAG